MPLSVRNSEVTQALLDLLDANAEPLGLKGTYYGDQLLIPEFPAACVESINKDRTLDQQASSHKFHLYLRSAIIVYHGKIQSSEVTQKAVEVLCEDIEEVLHEDKSLGGLVLWGIVTRSELTGVAAKADGVMYRASRLTWEGKSRQTF